MLTYYQEADHRLQQVNPITKLAVLLAVIAVLIVIQHPWPPLFMIVLSGLMLRCFGGVPLHRFLLVLSPFSLFALGFLWMHTLFPAVRGEMIVYSIGPIDIAWENFRTGLTFGLRALAFAAWSILFVMTTDPTRLMLSLVQNVRLPARFGYGMMAAYHFLPLLREEFRQVRLAHRIRGLGESGGIRGRWRQMIRYSVPLMAGAIRKAERVAIAMESKGFDDSRDRVFYRMIGFSGNDVLYGAFMMMIVLLLIVWYCAAY